MLQSEGIITRKSTGRAPITQFWAVAGEEFTGKNNFACSFPGPIGIIADDAGYERPFSKYPGKTFHVCNVQIPEPIVESSKTKMNPKSGIALTEVALNQEEYIAEWEKAVKAWKLFLSCSVADCRTVVVDTGKGLWDIFRGARMGSLTKAFGGDRRQVYGQLNMEFASIVGKGTPKAGCTKHVIWIDKMDDEWEDYTKDVWDQEARSMRQVEDRRRTGKVVRREGWKDIPYVADIMVQMLRTDTQGFGCRFMHKTGENPMLVGEEYWETTHAEFAKEYRARNVISYKVLAQELQLTLDPAAE